MAVTWTDGRSVQVVLDVLRPLVQVRADRKGVTWNSSSVDESFLLLAELASFSPPLNDHDRIGLVRAGVIEAIKSDRWSAGQVLKELTKQDKQYSRRPERSYRLLSTVSVGPSPETRRTRWGKVTLTLSEEVPDSFRLPDSAEHGKVNVIYGSFPTRYATLRTSVRARSVHAAFDNALHKADLLRAVWNLFFNYNKGHRISGGRIRPVNEICWGPLHTLHTPDGRPAGEEYWWEPSYVEELPRKDLRPEGPKLRDFERAIRAQLRESRYRSDLERALVRYARALDERELSTAFTRLWGLLEYLTATLKQKYSVTTRRAAFLFRHHDYHLIRLSALADRRNAVVHSGEDPAAIERMVFQAKRYVEEILIFALKNGSRFASLEELGQFLDLPANRGKLEDRLEKTKFALTMRS